MADIVKDDESLKGKVMGLGTPGSDPSDQIIDPSTKTQRELYIGNMPMGVTEAIFMEFMSTSMENAKMTIKPGNPVVQVRISAKFAFAEFRSIEETNSALNLDGIPMMGQPLRVGRPKAYVGPTTPQSNWSQVGISTNLMGSS